MSWHDWGVTCGRAALGTALIATLLLLTGCERQDDASSKSPAPSPVSAVADPEPIDTHGEIERSIKAVIAGLTDGFSYRDAENIEKMFSILDRSKNYLKTIPLRSVYRDFLAPRSILQIRVQLGEYYLEWGMLPKAQEALTPVAEIAKSLLEAGELTGDLELPFRLLDDLERAKLDDLALKVLKELWVDSALTFGFEAPQTVFIESRLKKVTKKLNLSGLASDSVIDVDVFRQVIGRHAHAKLSGGKYTEFVQGILNFVSRVDEIQQPNQDSGFQPGEIVVAAIRVLTFVAPKQALFLLNQSSSRNISLLYHFPIRASVPARIVNAIPWKEAEDAARKLVQRAAEIEPETQVEWNNAVESVFSDASAKLAYAIKRKRPQVVMEKALQLEYLSGVINSFSGALADASSIGVDTPNSRLRRQIELFRNATGRLENRAKKARSDAWKRWNANKEFSDRAEQLVSKLRDGGELVSFEIAAMLATVQNARSSREFIEETVKLLDQMPAVGGDTLPSLNVLVDGNISDLHPFAESREVHFATTRLKLASSSNDQELFGSQRSKTLNYGVANVSIPKVRGSDDPDLSDFDILELDYKFDPKRHVTLTSVRSIQSSEFFESVRRKTSPDNANAVLFVHGFNVSFRDALRRSGQLAHDLKLSGTMIAYIWPSEASMWSYNPDDKMMEVEIAAGTFGELLDGLRRSIGGKKLTIIAHSMGSRLAVSGLSELAARNAGARSAGASLPPPIRRLILAAADIGSAELEAASGRWLDVVDRATLYASTTDIAIALSRDVVNRTPRAGDATAMVLTRELDSIDSTKAESTDPLVDHSYFARGLLPDIRSQIDWSLPPARRCVLAPQQTKEALFWAFGTGACAPNVFAVALDYAKKYRNIDGAIRELRKQGRNDASEKRVRLRNALIEALVLMSGKGDVAKVPG